jgi:hypothetical protein
VSDAIREVEKRTPLRFPLWTGQKDWVTFVPDPMMLSAVGRRGGEQRIGVSPKGTVGHIIHEICHAIGMYHEHGREDRDEFVTIVTKHIRPGFGKEFQKVTDGDDVGAYDYASIMHYGTTEFAISPLRPTIRVKPLPGGGIPAIGQRVKLSDGDIAAIESMYG